MTDVGPRFSHFGVFVQNLENVVGFYRDALDFVETDRGVLNGRNIVFLSRDPREHHQLVFVAGLKQAPPEDIVNQISFRLPSLEALQRYTARAKAAGARDLVSINHGNAWAAYFRDPENNRAELFVDTPWYVPQPCRELIDLDRNPDEIRAETESWARAQDGFRPASEFQAEVAAKLEARMAAQGV